MVMIKQSPRAFPSISVSLFIMISLMLGACSRDVILKVCNTAPYAVNYALNYPIDEHEFQTDGLKKLEAGQCRDLERNFPDEIEPAFNLYARNVDPNDLRWLYNLGQEHPGILEWTGDGTSQCVNENSISHIVNNALPQNCSTEYKGFVKVETDKPDEDEWIYFIQDAALGIGLGNFKGTREDFLKVSRHQTKEQYQAIENQKQYQMTWEGREKPYDFGFSLENNPTDYSRFKPGVRIEEVVPKTIFQDEMPFQRGDILISLNGQNVYSYEDAYPILHEHATSMKKGILVPYSFSIIRSGQVVEGLSTYFFNERYWPSPEDDKLWAMYFGVANAMTIGAEALGHCTLKKIGNGVLDLAREIFDKNKKIKQSDSESFRKCRWRTNQYTARVKQKYLDYHDNAAWLGLITPSAPRLIFTGMLTKSAARVVGPGLARIAATTALETVETVAWTIRDSSPLTTHEELLRDAKHVAPYGAGIGFVAALIS